MGRKRGWLIVLIVLAMLVAACGPEMATPTPEDKAGAETPAATATEAEEPAGSATESASPPSGELPVNPDDWRVLGSPDAEVTIIEYSDFQ